jgi:hypothetical protein
MSSGSLAALTTGIIDDTAAPPHSVPLRDSGGGLTNGPETMTQLICSGSVSVKWNAQTASYAILWGASGDHVLFVDSTAGAVTLTLPAPATVGAGGVLRIIKKVVTNNLIIAPNGGEKINGVAASKTVTAANAIYEAFCDGTDWYIGVQTVI